ncbi:DNA-protecting protein DprA [Mesorhizobium loti]|nr:DNA-processing protein DprA [Mesorhizobium loti]PLP58749.1 DNA-protecting protein DprA [Mesorhizobium loti]
MTKPVAGLHLSDRQRLNWLRLIRTPNVGPASFRALINRFGSTEAALEVLPELTLSGGASRSVRIPAIAAIEAEMQAAKRAGARFVCIGEPNYPPLLKNMDHPPPVLAMKGSGAVFTMPTVAIVGARNASLAGIKMARLLAAELGRAGYAIVSGLARGIDTAAHQSSLPTGTVAVLAGGLDQPYPPENAGLIDEIIERGAVVSEMPFGWQPRAQDFPRRNRLVAGAALGLVVVEAAERSGSLISARLAADMGRLVFAVPGSPLDPRARGTNGLIKDGATLVTETTDILNALAPLIGTQSAPENPVEEPSDFPATPPPGDSERERVIGTLGQTPVNIDEIIRHTDLHPAQVAMVLLELDLAGRLERHTGGYVSLIFSH